MRQAILLICASACAVAIVACDFRAERSSDLRLSHTFDNPGAAAQAVLDSIRRRDAVRLRELALDEHEFRTLVWPELPASRPEVNLPFEYAWGLLRQNSAGSLAQVLGEHGGRRYELVDIRIRGESTRHASFTVHRKVELIARDGDGETMRVRLFGSLLEREGRWKIFSYVID